MFLESEALLGRIRAIAGEIAEKTENKVVFEEYIALPYYGNLVLRFRLTEPVKSIEELDAYENTMYDIVRDEFLIDFMGDVYRGAGLDYRNFDDLLRKAYGKYKEEPVFKTKYHGEIRQDAAHLLTLCGLDPHTKVWEIQPEEEILLLIMTETPGQSRTYPAGNRKITVIETDEICCEGMVKAAYYGKRNRQSLIRTLMDL